MKTPKFIQIISVLLIFTAMGWQLWANIDLLLEYRWQLQYDLIVSSTMVMMIVSISLAWVWGQILRELTKGSDFNQLELVIIWLNSMITKYVPGGIWNLVGRVYLCKQTHVDSTATISSMTIEICLVLYAQTILSVIVGLIYFLDVGVFKFILVVTLLFIPVFILLLPSGTIMKIVSSYPFILNRLPLPKLNRWAVFSWLCSYLILGFTGGVAFFLFTISIYPLNVYDLPLIVAFVNISFIVSLITPVAPNGLGVREGVLVMLLSYLIPTHIAIVIAVLSRFWMFLSDIFVVSGANLLTQFLATRTINY